MLLLLVIMQESKNASTHRLREWQIASLISRIGIWLHPFLQPGLDDIVQHDQLFLCGTLQAKNSLSRCVQH